MEQTTSKSQPENQAHHCPNCGTETAPEARFCAHCGSSLGAPEQTTQDAQPEYQVHYCSFHPDVETGLSCNRCEKYICPRCMVQTPVGARCRDCAQVRRLPTFDVKPGYYIRGSVAGVLVALVAGVIWGILRAFFFGFFSWLISVGIGYLIGEAVSQAVNRKRGPGLAWIVGISMGLAFVVSGLVWAGAPGLRHLLGRDIIGLLILGVSIFVAISRVR